MASPFTIIPFQPPSASEAVPSAPRSTGAEQGPASCAMNGGLMALMVLAIYFLMIRPQQRQAKATDKMLRSIRPGLNVRTRGGLRGEVLEDKGEELVIRIADKVKVNVLRSHVASVESTPGAVAKVESTPAKAAS